MPAPLHGLEARSRVDDHAALKLWLRMLSCVNDVEAEIRWRLRDQFDITLPRFDFLAQLYRWPEGLRMNELSQRLMVSGGNVTTLTDELEREGLVTRQQSPTDRRAWIVQLTAPGRARFETMAQAHERWILELFEPLAATPVKQLYRQLGVLRHHLLDTKAARPPAGPAAAVATPTTSDLAP